jgi:hypothetical protein
VSTADATVPEIVRGLVDDAAIFPPGNAPLEEALAAHRQHRSAPYADLVGPFVVADRDLAALRDVVSRPLRDASSLGSSGQVAPLAPQPPQSQKRV